MCSPRLRSRLAVSVFTLVLVLAGASLKHLLAQRSGPVSRVGGDLELTQFKWP